jgi:hypothetical protein
LIGDGGKIGGLVDFIKELMAKPRKVTPNDTPAICFFYVFALNAFK